VSGPEDPRPGADWETFRSARERFFARVRPEAMDDPPAAVCPDALPEEWPPPRPDAGSDPETAGG
jgi:hypothetical protein